VARAVEDDPGKIAEPTERASRRGGSSGGIAAWLAVGRVGRGGSSARNAPATSIVASATAELARTPEDLTTRALAVERNSRGRRSVL
jgi:hypothetical protein